MLSLSMRTGIVLLMLLGLTACERIGLADPASLRRQIGVVLQESQLFNGTIRDNIALSDPGAPRPAKVGFGRN